MLNVDLSLAHYAETPAKLPSGLRSYRHTARFKAPAPVGLYGDLEVLASLSPSIDPKEVAKLDQDRKAGAYLRDKLKGVTLTPFQARLLTVLIEEDWEFHQRKKRPLGDAKGIDQLPSGRYRLRTTVDGKSLTLTFDTLAEAVERKAKLKAKCS